MTALSGAGVGYFLVPGDSRLLTFTRAGRLDQVAPLHDLGQLAVGDAGLLKPGRLSAPEFEQVKKHPRAGAAILTGSASELLQLAEEVACTHHE